MASGLKFVYNLVVILLLPFALLRLFWRSRRYPEARQRWRERLGYVEQLKFPERPIWIHAVSVGESNAAEPLISGLFGAFPHYPLVISTTTATGAETVKNRYLTRATHVFYPFDLPFVVRRFVTAVKPAALILMETELWPNMLDQCRRQGIPVILVNGRLSQRAAGRYLRFASLSADMMSQISCFAVQSPADAERFEAIGAPREKITVTGSLKFDRELAPSVVERGAAIRRLFGNSRLVIMAGSTRDGEEALILDAFRTLQQDNPALLLIIAPRHPERFDVVADLIERRKFTMARHSIAGTATDKADVFLLDVMGELASYYAAADIAFVGGSLVPLGGHNTLEPAGLGVPIIVGPHAFNFSEINQKLAAAGGLIVVQDGTDLVHKIAPLLADSNYRDAMGLRAREVFESNRGALNRVMEIIETHLGPERENVS